MRRIFIWFLFCGLFIYASESFAKNLLRIGSTTITTKTLEKWKRTLRLFGTRGAEDDLEALADMARFVLEWEVQKVDGSRVGPETMSQLLGGLERNPRLKVALPQLKAIYGEEGLVSEYLPMVTASEMLYVELYFRIYDEGSATLVLNEAVREKSNFKALASKYKEVHYEVLSFESQEASKKKYVDDRGSGLIERLRPEIENSKTGAISPRVVNHGQNLFIWKRMRQPSIEILRFKKPHYEELFWSHAKSIDCEILDEKLREPLRQKAHQCSGIICSGYEAAAGTSLPAGGLDTCP